MSDLVELTIHSEYLDWTVKECVRDLMQNAIDADVKGWPMHVEHSDMGLEITNVGAKIPRKTLLIGFSTKRDDDTQVGQFGEGLKLACLGLVKKGIALTIENQDEVWTPKIVYSKNFEQDVLAYEITKNEKVHGNFTIMIEGISEEDWKDYQKCFLKLREDLHDVVNFEVGGFGKIIDIHQNVSSAKGSIFIGGILVEEIKDEEFEYIYNLNPGVMQTDRDRRMVSRTVLKSKTSDMWKEAANKDDQMFEKYYRLISNDTTDVIATKNEWHFPDNLKKKVHDKWKLTYGDDAYPVTDPGTAESVEFHGLNPVPVSECLMKFLKEFYPTLAELDQQQSETIIKTYDPYDLSKSEQASYKTAVEMIVSAGRVLNPIKIVDFNSDNLLGMHKKAKVNKIYIARHCLSSSHAALRVLVHEHAHDFGGHDNKGFQDYVEETWRDIYELMHARYTNKRTFEVFRWIKSYFLSVSQVVVKHMSKKG